MMDLKSMWEVFRGNRPWDAKGNSINNLLGGSFSNLAIGIKADSSQLAYKSFSTVQGAVNYAGSGGKVIVGEGTFTERVALPSYFTLVGLGYDSIIKLPDSTSYNASTGAGVIRNNDFTTGNEYIKIANLKVDGNKSNQSPGGDSTEFDGIDFKESNWLNIHDVWVQNAYDAGIDTDHCSYGVISDTFLSDNGGAGVHISYSGGLSKGFYIDNCISEGNGTIRTNVSGYGFNIPSDSLRCSISNCLSQADYGGFYVNDRVNISNCRATNADTRGFWIGSELASAQYVGLSNCQADYNGESGFYVEGSYHTLTGCIARSNGQDGTADQQRGFWIVSTYTNLSGCVAEGQNIGVYENGDYNLVGVKANNNIASNIEIHGSNSRANVGYEDRGDPLTYDYTDTDLTIDGSYHALDLSSIVPSWARKVYLAVIIQSGSAGDSVKFRENGNSNQRNMDIVYTQGASNNRHKTVEVSCDTGQIIDYSATNVSWNLLTITVRGWE